jgi:ribonuclease J
MVSITVYRGVAEIGGNKILLEDGDTRLFFDFGMSFGERGKYYEEFLAPRDGAGLLDVLEMGLLPPLRGIYREDLVPAADLWARYQHHRLCRELSVDGVLLSHAHLDHCGDISFLSSTIPVYCTAMTAFLAKATQDSGASGLEREVCYCNPRQAKEKEPLLADYLGVAGDYQQRSFVLADIASLSPKAEEFWRRSPAATKGMQAGDLKLGAETLGSLRVTHFPVDHSVYGACAWLVETSAGPVLYTGDLRRHGARREATEQFVAQARALEPQVLLCEGTHVDAIEPPTREEEVLGKARGYVSRAEGKLVIADFAARDIERLQTFLRIAQESGRLLVILSKDAYLLDALSLLSDGIPNLSSHGSLRLYKELKGSLSAWERGLLQAYQDKLVRAEDVRRSPGDFILCFSFFDLNELPSIAPEGGLYIYSCSEAFDEERQMDIDRLHHWLGHFQMEGVGLPQRDLDGKPRPEERGLHASGHASGPELIEMVRQIGPKMLIPVHTEHPEIFQQALAGTGIDVRIPSLGEEIVIG